MTSKTEILSTEKFYRFSQTDIFFKSFNPVLYEFAVLETIGKYENKGVVSLVSVFTDPLYLFKHLSHIALIET